MLQMYMIISFTYFIDQMPITNRKEEELPDDPFTGRIFNYSRQLDFDI